MNLSTSNFIEIAVGTILLATVIYLFFYRLGKVKRKLASLALFPEQNPNPVIEIEFNGKATYMNPAAKKLFPDMKKKGFKHPLFSVIYSKIAAYNNNGIESFSCETILNGCIYEQKVHPIPDTDLLRVYSSDITERKATERKLANLALFPEQNPNSVIEIELNGKVNYINPATRKFFPNIVEQGFSHPLFEVIFEQRENFSSGKIQAFNCEVKVDESIFEQKVYAIPESNLLRVYSSDITERKRTEQIIRQRNQDITDSINYAKRIQQALLAQEGFIQKYVPEFFVLYKPKDIVSGDYYWAEYKDGYFFIATADCTGHGVPGAFMSMLGISYLNEIISERDIHSPEKVLDILRQNIISALNPKNSEEDRKDGMDMVLCRYDFTNMQLQFAAANNGLYLVRNSAPSPVEKGKGDEAFPQLIEYKPDKFPVGKYGQELKPFSLQHFQLQKGDCIYTFSDGYCDQFGGPQNRKFMSRQFKELLLKNAALSMNTQKSILEKEIEQWMGASGQQQIDDILVIGVKV